MRPGWDILQRTDIAQSLIIFLFTASQQTSSTEISTLCLSILGLLSSLNKDFFADSATVVYNLIIEGSIEIIKRICVSIKVAPEPFREVCVLISRVNRNIEYSEHNIYNWLSAVFGLTAFVLNSSFTDNETLTSLGYLLDFWSTISRKACSYLGLKERLVSIYKGYIEFYERAVLTNEDLRTAHEMLVIYKEPLKNLGRVCLLEVEKWLCGKLNEIQANPTEEKLWTLPLLIYAGSELFKSNAEENSLGSESIKELNTLEYAEAYSNTAATILQVIESTKALKSPITLIQSFVSYSNKLIRRFCKETATLNKVATKLLLPNSNIILDYTIKLLVEVMESYTGIPELLNKTTRAIRKIIECTSYEGGKYLCGCLVLTSSTIDSLFSFHLNGLDIVLSSPLLKNLYYSLARLLFLVLLLFHIIER